MLNKHVERINTCQVLFVCFKHHISKHIIQMRGNWMKDLNTEANVQKADSLVLGETHPA